MAFISPYLRFVSFNVVISFSSIWISLVRKQSCLTSTDGVSSFPARDAYPKDASPNAPVSGTNRESHGDANCQSQTLLWIKIESSNEQASTSFCIPVSLMWQREVEMQAAARANNVGKERWTCSRIFRMWKSQCARQQQRQNPDASSEIFLRLTPEVSLQNSNSSCRLFRWKPWLTMCISSYYNTGNVRIPDECTGDDILLTLEYFGILIASPDDFVFDTSHAYVRTQAWSRYFTHRAILAESLLEAYDDAEIEESGSGYKESGQNERKANLESTSHFRATLFWVLLEEGEEESVAEDIFYVIRKDTSCRKAKSEKPLYDRRRSARTFTVKNNGGLYDLFFGKKEAKRNTTLCEEDGEEKEATTLSKEMPSRMRQDFCEHLRQSLPPWISVQFAIEVVEVAPIRKMIEQSPESTTETRPVLRIFYDHPLSTASILKKEGESSITSHLESVQVIRESGVVMSDRSLGATHVPLFLSTEKSILLDSDKTDNHFNGHNCNTLEETESQVVNDDTGSRENFDTVDAKSTVHSLNESETLNKTQQPHKPITYVNTDFGDLRSVTSVLSEPTMHEQKIFKEIVTNTKAIAHGTDKKQCKDGSTVLVTAKQIVQKRSERVNQKHHVIDRKRSKNPSASLSPSETPRDAFDQNIKTPPRATRKLRTTPPWDLSRMSNTGEDEEDFRKYINGNDTSRSDPRVNAVKSTEPSDASESDDENSDTKSKTAQTDCHGSWGHLLASMCEAMIPASSSSVLSSSPIRQFQLSSNKNILSTAAWRDDGYQTCIGKETNETEPEPVGIVDQAMKMGNDLSNQFDELMRIAYDDDNHDGGHLNVNKSLSPIQEEIPGILSIDTNEDLTLASCLTSSVIGQPHNMNSAQELDKPQKMKNDSLPRKIRTTMTSTSRNRINERRGPRLNQEDKWEAVRKTGNARDFSIKSTVSKIEQSMYNSVQINGESSTGSKFASIYDTPSGEEDYSKENRYSQQENRFYA